MRGDLLEQVVDLGGAGLRHPVLAAGSARVGRVGGEGAVDRADLFQARRIDEVDVFAILDIAPAGGDGLAHLRLGGAAGVDAQLHVVGVQRFRDLCGGLGVLQVGGVLFKVLGELRAEILVQHPAVSGENVQHAMAVAQPPLAGEWIEDEAVVAQKLQHGVVVRRFLRRQGDGEEVLRAVDKQRSGGGVGSRWGRRRACRWSRIFDRPYRNYGPYIFIQQLAHARQLPAVPRQWHLRCAAVEKNRLAGEGGDEFAQLGSRELHQRDRLGPDAETLQDGEPGQQGRRRRHGQVQFHAHGDRIARHGGGEVGGQQQAEHDHL